MIDRDPFNSGLKAFLAASPSPYQAVASMVSVLAQAGFQSLDEGDEWSLMPGQGYYVVRGGSSLIAFRVGLGDIVSQGVRMVGAHTDSPCLKVKPNPELTREGMLQLGVEVYGGALLAPWFDRDLSLAGRVFYRAPGESLPVPALLDFERPIALIPSLAIHLNRDANKGQEFNAQLHLPPVIQQACDGFDFRELLKDELRHHGHTVDQVVDYDLFFYDTQVPASVGLDESLLTSARLDNLLSCWTGLQALCHTQTDQTSLLVCTDHEEVGSASAIGAEGPFLESVLRRLAGGETDYQRLIHHSLLISCDNAHAVHPNYRDRHDERHGPQLNAGPVIKLNANQRYASTSETSALFRYYCQEADVPVQSFVVRSDMGCGSTIGPISSTQLGVRTVDVGAPQWAMHSIREVCGRDDAWYLARALEVFMQSRQC